MTRETGAAGKPSHKRHLAIAAALAFLGAGNVAHADPISCELWYSFSASESCQNHWNGTKDTNFNFSYEDLRDQDRYQPTLVFDEAKRVLQWRPNKQSDLLTVNGHIDRVNHTVIVEVPVVKQMVTEDDNPMVSLKATYDDQTKLFMGLATALTNNEVRAAGEKPVIQEGRDLDQRVRMFWGRCSG